MVDGLGLLHVVAGLLIGAIRDGPGEALLPLRQYRIATLRQVSVRAADRLLDVHRRGVGDEVLGAAVAKRLVLGSRAPGVVVAGLVGCGEVDDGDVGGRAR